MFAGLPASFAPGLEPITFTRAPVALRQAQRASVHAQDVQRLWVGAELVGRSSPAKGAEIRFQRAIASRNTDHITG